MPNFKKHTGYQLKPKSSHDKTRAGLILSKIGQACGIGGDPCPKGDYDKNKRKDKWKGYSTAGKIWRGTARVIGAGVGLGLLGLATGKIPIGGDKSGGGSSTPPSGPLMKKPKMLMKKRKNYA